MKAGNNQEERKVQGVRMSGSPKNGFWKDERGSIMITFAVMLNALVMAVALSMDLGRGFMASSAIGGAADAAAMASAVEGGSDAKAKAYFTANLPNKTLGISYNYDTDVTHTIDTTNNTVAVDTKNFKVPAYFSKGTNLNSSIDIGGGVQVGMATGGFLPADYYFVVDSSGSMQQSSGSGNSKAQAVNTALNSFLDIVFKNQGVDKNGISNYRISLSNYNHQRLLSFPLSDDRATIQSNLAPMVSAPVGGTCGGCGWQEAKEQYFADINAGVPPERLRVFIFLTDGEFNVATGSLSAPPDWPSIINSPPHAMAAVECYAIKNLIGVSTPDATEIQQNTTIWAIRFGAGANGGLAVNKYIMDYCASDITQSVYARTGNDLDQIFSKIGRATSRIRVLK